MTSREPHVLYGAWWIRLGPSKSLCIDYRVWRYPCLFSDNWSDIGLGSRISAVVMGVYWSPQKPSHKDIPPWLHMVTVSLTAHKDALSPFSAHCHMWPMAGKWGVRSRQGEHSASQTRRVCIYIVCTIPWSSPLFLIAPSTPSVWPPPLMCSSQVWISLHGWADMTWFWVHFGGILSLLDRELWVQWAKG